MTALAITSWLVRLLGRIPPPLHRALDRWSHRIALQKRDRRRLARKMMNEGKH